MSVSTDLRNCADNVECEYPGAASVMRVAAQDLENACEIMARLRTELPIPAGVGLVDHCLALRDQLAAAKTEQARLSGQVQYLKDQVKEQVEIAKKAVWDIDDVRAERDAAVSERDLAWAKVRTWTEAFDNPQSFACARDDTIEGLHSESARLSKEVSILAAAVTDGVANLKLARRIWRDLRHCIGEIPREKVEILELYRERLHGYGPLLGNTADYRFAIEDSARVKRLTDVLRTVRALAVIGCEHPLFTVTWDGKVLTGAQVLGMIDKALDK